MMRLFSALVLVLATALGASAATTPEQPGKRVALVIGNSNYQHAVNLPNPANDAKLMAATLRGAGFQVIDGIDLDREGMKSAIDKFTEAAYDADVGLIYYAGHGLQVDGKNFLIPVDAELTAPAHLKTRAVQVDDLMAALPPDPAVGIVVLDACRDNPMARTLAATLPATRSASLGSGLAAVQATSNGAGTGGILIAYATDPGAIALDGKGTDSPYTIALAKHIVEPGVDIQSALTRVRSEVVEATKGRQRPWSNASLGREVYLGGPAQKPASEPTIVLGENPKPAAEVAAADAGPSDWEIEQRLWDEASKRNTLAHYQLYLEKYPNGRFAEVAKLNMEGLKQGNAAQQMASAEPAEALPSSGSAVRNAVAVPDEVKTVPGTKITEAALNLDRDGRIDLQLRLEAVGKDVGAVDGKLSAKTRHAIADWQTQNGLPPTTFLTLQQYDLLKAQTDPMMEAVRAQYQRDLAAARDNAKRKQQTVQKEVRKQQKYASNRRRRAVADDYDDDYRGPRKLGRVEGSGGGSNAELGALVGGALAGGIAGALIHK